VLKSTSRLGSINEKSTEDINEFTAREFAEGEIAAREIAENEIDTSEIDTSEIGKICKEIF
jgi:hypothetical protein